jgi:predicted ATPase
LKSDAKVKLLRLLRHLRLLRLFFQLPRKPGIASVNPLPITHYPLQKFMSIQSFTLKNYRSFVDRTTIELRPLTLLFGYNNSGKSALLRALPLIADSLNGQSRNTSLALDSPAVRGSHFKELLSHIGSAQEFDLELSLADEDIQRLKWMLRGVFKLKAHVISNFSVLGSNGTTLLSGHFKSSTDKKRLPEYDVQLAQDSAIYEQVLQFEGLLPSLLPKQPTHALPAQLVSLIEQCQKLKHINTRIQWLSSIRQSPLRNNPFKGVAPNYLEPDGRGAAEILAYDSIFEELDILPAVSRWYEDNLRQKIVVEEMPDYFQIKLQPVIEQSFRVNIVDVGEGLIQLLPVLVATVRANEGDIDILAIEEPESHLHPRHHAALAAHFCELARQNNSPKLLLETHSENFLLRVQLEIVQRKLDPELVKVYWIRQLDDERSIAEPVTFDHKGRPQGRWPRDVFYTDIELSRQLVQERRKHL